jgi:hypothetical protein
MSPSSDAKGKYPHEINFFNRRTRSMIIVVYTIHESPGGPRLLLESVAATPFRCQLGCEVGDRQRLPSVEALTKTLAGWQGQRLSFGPQTPLDERRQPSGAFDPQAFASSPAVSAVLQDNLALAVPEEIVEGAPFRLTFGCLQQEDLFKQVTIAFDTRGALAQWTLDEYRPPARA